jgi:hypothetical protein
MIFTALRGPPAKREACCLSNLKISFQKVMK